MTRPIVDPYDARVDERLIERAIKISELERTLRSFKRGSLFLMLLLCAETGFIAWLMWGMLT